MGSRNTSKYPKEEGDDASNRDHRIHQGGIPYQCRPRSLTTYLSMRIRHGSLAGHLRSPLDERGLIVAKDEGGKYEDNNLIAQKVMATGGVRSGGDL